MAFDRSSSPEDLTLRPLIADILRTRYCLPNSLLLLESLTAVLPTRSRHKRAVRLLLSDGTLCIQALLTCDMHRFADTGELTEGCLVRLHIFELCEEEVEGGRMVYLRVEDFSVVGWCEEFEGVEGVEEPGLEAGASEVESEDEDGWQVSTPEDIAIPSDVEPQVPDSDEEASEPPATPPAQADLETIHESDFEDLDDFDPKTPPPKTPPQQQPSTPDLSIPSSFPDLSIPETPPLPAPVALPRDWTSPYDPLKLTTLSSIPHLPYRQNWSINTLAIISSLSPLQPSTFPPYKQREARLADPSTPKRVLLTIFLDAEAFTPRVGEVILLAGVKNHLFDGGSLKKYASDRPREGMGWWYEEPGFAWCRDRVRELRAWWALEAGD